MWATTEVLRSIAATALPSRTVIWSGAGTSLAYPTCLPSGSELVERIFRHLIDLDALETILATYRMLEVKRSLPRLEMVIDSITSADSYGQRGLDCLSDLISAPPNESHAFFAWHVEQGGSHITANFDVCIEEAGELDSAGRERVLHFHGSVNRGLDGLGATLRAIERGLTDEIKHRLSQTLSQALLLVVVGYSGSDFFDVDPFLQNYLLSQSWANRTVVWVSHDRRPGLQLRRITASGSAGQRQADWFAEAGASVYEVKGPTYAALNAIASDWGHPVLDPTTRTCLSRWVPAFTASAADRQRATLRLFQQTCHRAEVRRLLDEVPSLRSIADVDGTSADLAWAEGRYADARRLWRSRFAGVDENARLRRLERIAATLWVQGRLIPAYAVLKRALRGAPAHASGTILLAETMLNVMRDMRRTVGLRRFASERQQSRYAQMLPRNVGDFGFHMRARLGPKLVAASDGTSNLASQEIFLEADAFHPLLNYRQAAIRASLRRGETLSLAEYRSHTSSFHNIGAGGDAVRSMFLPGAPCAFSMAELVRAIWTVQVGMWQRARWIGRSLADKARCAVSVP